MMVMLMMSSISIAKNIDDADWNRIISKHYKYKTNSFYWEMLGSKDFDKYFFYKVDLFEVVNDATKSEYRISYNLYNRHNDKLVFNHIFSVGIEKKKPEINWTPVYVVAGILGALITGGTIYLGVKLNN